MRYYLLEPEVAGGLGRNTVLDRTSHPPVVTRLHYEFDGWLGDELLESFPCFIVTQRLRVKIEELGFTGVRFSPVEVTLSTQFKTLYPDREVPQFVWLKVDGEPCKDDLGLATDHRLIVSERTLVAMNLKQCVVTPVS